MELSISRFLNLSTPLRLCVAFFVLFAAISAKADDRTAVEKLSVFGKKEVLPTRPGSAHVLTSEELEKFDFNDIHRVLRSVPGVNLQEEDGFGLRPNIGLRGGHPHRSKKVAVFEDGVLIGPAPYSAPAAYYFPLLDKIDSIEVFKGVPSTAFGPNSISGALNLVTRMNEPGVKLGINGGSFGFQKYNFSAGIETWGDFSIDASRIESTGFKELQNSDNTGFVQHNFTLRWDKYFVHKDQNLAFKFNWADEVSNETYAGLTDADFAANPVQRYVATENDKMDWTHRQLFLSYAVSPIEDLRARLTLYHHGFARSWNKLNGFGGTNPANPSAQIRDVLDQPALAANNYFYQVLSGQANSGVLDDNRDVLDVGDNQRQYLSQGVQTHFTYEITGYEWDHLLQLSVRYHEDQINRFHESRYYNMQNSQMVLNTGLAQRTTLLNQDQAQAITTALSYETTVGAWTSQAIVRAEDINYQRDDYQTGLVQESGDSFMAPGLGVFYQAFQNTGFLLGVNKGYTPVGPGQAADVNPEEAINFELGVRHTGPVGVELIGFLSDYENLLGTCTQSAGCLVNQLDQSFNGGESRVMGVEFLLHTDFKTVGMNFPVRLTSTYTQAEFLSSFQTLLPEWGPANGQIRVGDPIPYIPTFQTNLMLGWEWGRFSTYLNVNYLGELADQAVAEGRKIIPSRFVSGLAMAYQINPAARVKFRVDNITDERYAVSNRPFGLRPGRPLTAIAGFEYAFF